MKNFLLKSLTIIAISLYAINLFAANNPPVAVNDTLYVNSSQNYVFNPIQNDYDPDGDPFVIITATFLHNSGHIVISNSTIAINMYYSSGIDTIAYRLKDNHNGISNIGYIIVHINNNHTSDTLNINNISAPFVPFGNAFWDFSSSSHFEVPKGSGTTTIFTSVPWIGGLDQANNLHLAAETYRSNGTDYYYGPVCDTTTLYQYSDSLWNRVWKISKAEIDYHKNHYWQSSYVIPEAIANWPAVGDTLLGQNAIMAPYIDKNNDGKYVPSDGDYPKIRGDQSVFIIFNDSRNAHTESGGAVLGLEFHETAYAYNCSSDTALNNTIFVHYDIINRSATNYHNVHFGLFTDFDIGYPNDDYIGCDSTRSLAYGYNAYPTDTLHAPNYGFTPPAQGIVFLSESMSNFIAFYNTGGDTSQTDPKIDSNYYNAMQSKWSDGSHLTYGGRGYGGTTAVNYQYSGDPNDSTTWSERYPQTSPQHLAHDRRGLSSIASFNLDAGAVKSIDLAYVYARDTTKSNFQNVSVLKYYVDKIRLYYDNDSTPCGGSFSAIDSHKKVENNMKVYPVPAEDKLLVDYKLQSTQVVYEVYSIAGRLIESGMLSKPRSNTIDISSLHSGLYFILIRDKQQVLSRKFIVQ
ncbi:MAG: hypothetical protein DSY76_09440 [Bacteroidetes bacterium]|nr:MAG: hypothetical protein DSY76_09440 [Bacteroidota bacterium]